MFLEKILFLFSVLTFTGSGNSKSLKVISRRVKRNSFTIAERFSASNSSPKAEWKVNEGLNSTFFQGDIVLTNDQIKLLNARAKSRGKRAIKKDSNSRWRNGVIPYVLDKRLKHSAKVEIHKAIRHWKRHTCLRFHKKRSKDVDYLRFVAEDGCWSTVGRKGGKQDIGVGNGCEYAGTIIHEIGHAVGFWHEQSRSDRDKYVRVVWKNIERRYHEQFDKMNANLMDSMGYAYDYESVMHYGSKFFTKNNKHTLRILKSGPKNVRIGQRKRLSDIDIAQVNAMYNCNRIATANSARCIKSKTRDGRDYGGKLSYTEKGVTCQSWDSQWPHRHRFLTKNHFINFKKGLMVRNSRGFYIYHNYCRNPNGRRARPWCFTTLTNTTWQYCDLKIC